MDLVKTQTTDNYITISLDRGKANPMNSQMITELRELFGKLEKDESVHGIILTGKEHFFSAGLDVIELYDFDEQQLKDFWLNFTSLIRELAAFRKPIIAAISGHSPAGGCVLALCCDYRIMVEGEYKIGLNEIPVGITLPQIIFDLYSFTLGTRLAYQNLIEGRMLYPVEALQQHLVDEICPESELLSRAEKKLKLYLSFNANTWQHSKLNIRKNFINSLNLDFEESFRATLQDWWAPETRKRMEEVVASLKK